MVSGKLKLVLYVALTWTAAFAQSSKIIEATNVPADLPDKRTINSTVRQKITLRVDDVTKFEPAALAEARKVTAMIFKEAGLEADWIDCPASEADCGDGSSRPQFRVRIVLPDREKGIDPKGEVLGFAMPCARTDKACLAYVLYSHVSARAKEHCVSPGLILGHVIAHEIGHSLLGPNGHTLWGIMQAGLPIEEVGRLLYFTPAQTERLRTELWVRSRLTDKAPIGNTLR